MIFRAVYSLDPDDRVPRRTGATGLGPCCICCIIACQIIRNAHHSDTDVSLAERRVLEFGRRLESILDLSIVSGRLDILGVAVTP